MIGKAVKPTGSNNRHPPAKPPILVNFSGFLFISIVNNEWVQFGLVDFLVMVSEI